MCEKNLHCSQQEVLCCIVSLSVISSSWCWPINSNIGGNLGKSWIWLTFLWRLSAALNLLTNMLTHPSEIMSSMGVQVQKLVAESILKLPWKEDSIKELPTEFTHRQLLGVFAAPGIAKGELSQCPVLACQGSTTSQDKDNSYASNPGLHNFCFLLHAGLSQQMRSLLSNFLSLYAKCLSQDRFVSFRNACTGLAITPWLIRLSVIVKGLYD